MPSFSIPGVLPQSAWLGHRVAAGPVRRVARACAAVLVVLACGARAVPACVGDCDDDGEVTINELITGVNIALENAVLEACSSFDSDHDGQVAVNEILSGVNALLAGCVPTPVPSATTTPRPTETPTHTATHTSSATVTRTPTVTATPTPNLPPVVPTFGVYRAYAGTPIGMPINASDPEGQALTYGAGALPEGAQLDPTSGVLSWTPAANQLGPFYVSFTVSDPGVPEQTVPGQLVFAVVPPDACTQLVCDPATGCQATLKSHTSTCCGGVALTRVAEPVSDCPGARVVFAGRNSFGFGRLRNCDVLRLANSGQTSAMLQLNVETRCMRTDDAPVTVHVRLESSSPVRRLVVDDSATVNMQPGPDGYAQRLQQGVRMAVKGGGPYFDLEGAEANLTVTVRDFDGVSVTHSVRVVLTFQPLPDLPETP